jgi:putative transposase
MRLSVEIQILPSVEQRALLLATMRQFNAAATHAARMGFNRKVFNRFGLGRLTYHESRKRFGLKSELSIRAFGKVAEVFARNRAFCPVFRPLSALAYSDRGLTYLPGDTVSILTLTGRERIPFVCGEYQRRLLPNLKGESDLVFRAGAALPAPRRQPAGRSGRRRDRLHRRGHGCRECPPRRAMAPTTAASESTPYGCGSSFGSAASSD